ncbi:unnamed protein product [Clonostachys rosea f. rosea IK726]|uniref:Uncharacterized protein n=1 Tax=Clonostachys rosea f. rosea IK726 TaxID=1349383 RepID=A0ACA9UV25_BIOOC|nr:unnamed protein product [Clonostachys rosea f. rosea IK726]
MALGDVLLCALALASSGVALPTKNGPKAAAQLNRREEITAYDDSLAAPTTVAAEVAYLQGGAPVSTDTKTIVVLPTAPRSVSLPSDDADAKILEALGLPGSAAPSPTAPGKADKFGISYAPYRGDHGCKDARDVQNDFDQLKDYSVIRIYGTDCDQVSKTYKAAKNTKTKLMLGVWDINDVENEVSKIIAGVEGGWDKIQAVSVGNEVVNKGEANPQKVIGAIKKARSMLRGAGFKGPVVTVDTFNAVEKHPELCEASDFCAINAHAFFDSTTSASHAGKWLDDTVQRVKLALSKPMDVVVTETGWPMDGSPNGLAIPSLENQKLAIESIKKAFSKTPGDVVLFSAFNDLWKTKSMDTFNAEQFYGIGGAISKSDRYI